MAHAERCPVCDGSGQTTTSRQVLVLPQGSIDHGGFVATPDVDGVRTLTVHNQAPCDGCEGKGWVIVPDDVQDVPYLWAYDVHLPPLVIT